MKYTDKQIFEIGLPGARDAGSAADMGFKAHNSGAWRTSA